MSSVSSSMPSPWNNVQLIQKEPGFATPFLKVFTCPGYFKVNMRYPGLCAFPLQIMLFQYKPTWRAPRVSFSLHPRFACKVNEDSSKAKCVGPSA
eukprot:6192517-Pleurochrysis_carterae.AAC.1